MWKGINWDVLQDTRTLLKASNIHCKMYEGPRSFHMHTVNPRRAISHPPLLGKRYTIHPSWEHKQAHVQEHHACAPWDTLLHRLLPLPHTSLLLCPNKQVGLVPPSPQAEHHWRQHRLVHLHARSKTAAPSTSPRCLPIPAAPCRLQYQHSGSPAALQSYQQAPWQGSRIQAEAMAIRPQNEHLNLKARKQKAHTTTNHTHTKQTSRKSDIDRANPIIPGFLSDWHQPALCVPGVEIHDLRGSDEKTQTHKSSVTCFRKEKERSKASYTSILSYKPSIQQRRAGLPAPNLCCQAPATLSVPTNWEAKLCHLLCLRGQPLGISTPASRRAWAGACSCLHQPAAEQEPSAHRSGHTRRLCQQAAARFSTSPTAELVERKTTDIFHTASCLY